MKTGPQRAEEASTGKQRDGALPPVMPDPKAFPAAMALPAARLPRIRSFVTVPVRLSDGSLSGTFCAAGLTSDPELTERDRALMEVLASAAATLVEPGLRERARAEEVEARLRPVLAAGGPLVLLQPIVDLATGLRLGAEALSRFPREWGKAPDACFAEAHSVGLGHRLELLALERAAEHLAVASGYVAMNVSPATFLRPECVDLLDRLPLDRVAYVHVAGGAEHQGLYHDTHTDAVPQPVLDLVTELCSRHRPPALMLERDGDYPPAAELRAELDAIARAAGYPTIT